MIQLPAVFSSGAVFQQKSTVLLHGTASENRSVSVRLVLCRDGSVLNEYRADANENGRFQVELKAPAASFDTYRIELSDGEPLVLDHILFGEVWIAAGQSNMEYQNFAADGHEDFYKSVENDTIRYYRQEIYIDGHGENTMYPNQPFEPSDELGGVWSDARDIGNFSMISAVASSFAKEIYEFLNTAGEVPVAILAVPVGGVFIEAYLAREDIEENPDIYAYLKAADRLPEKDKWNQRGAMNYTQSTGLYNSKIFPLRGLKFRGVLWYQGENNVVSSAVREDQSYYQKALTVLRKRFEILFKEDHHPNFPLIASELAPYVYGNDTVCNLNYLNEAISNTVKSDPLNFAAIPVYDVPVKWDFVDNHPIHTCVKYPIGERMALCAKSLAYHHNGVKTAPMDRDIEFRGNKLIISFSDTGKGLCTKNNDKVRGFWICGENRIYVPADAKIISPDAIELQNEFIENPQYAAYHYPSLDFEGNVYSIDGLPLAPFATDKTGEVRISAKPWLNLNRQRMWVHEYLTDEFYDVFYHPVWHAVEGSLFCTDDIFTLSGTSLRIFGTPDRIGVSLLHHPAYDLDCYRFRAMRISVLNLKNDLKLEFLIRKTDSEKIIRQITAVKIGDLIQGWAEYEFNFTGMEECVIEKMSFLFNSKDQKYKFVNIDDLKLVP